jgi:hypothetical protein
MKINCVHDLDLRQRSKWYRRLLQEKEKDHSYTTMLKAAYTHSFAQIINEQKRVSIYKFIICRTDSQHHVSSKILKHHVSSKIFKHHVSSKTLKHHVSSKILKHHVSSKILKHHVSSMILKYHVSPKILKHHVSSKILKHHV